MPQLNSEFFLSQLFWLVCFFIAIYIYVQHAFIPKVSVVLQTRDKKIRHDLAAAEKLTASCQQLLLEADRILETAREQAAQARFQAAQKARTAAIVQAAALEESLQAKFAGYEKDLVRLREQMVFELNNESPMLEGEVWRVMHLSMQHPTSVNDILKN